MSWTKATHLTMALATGYYTDPQGCVFFYMFHNVSQCFELTNRLWIPLLFDRPAHNLDWRKTSMSSISSSVKRIWKRLLALHHIYGIQWFLSLSVSWRLNVLKKRSKARKDTLIGKQKQRGKVSRNMKQAPSEYRYILRIDLGMESTKSKKVHFGVGLHSVRWGLAPATRSALQWWILKYFSDRRGRGFCWLPFLNERTKKGSCRMSDLSHVHSLSRDIFMRSDGVTEWLR